MREFNTSGPNIPSRHYTIQRTNLIEKGIKLVHNERYFTIWAPRQTGKSTYFRQLAEQLIKQGYKAAHINFENYRNASLKSFLSSLSRNLKEQWGFDYSQETDLSHIFELIQTQKTEKCVLIIDEVEGINKEYFGDFLHSIRNAYHSRENHCLKSVILVGVSNITGIVSDNASPFNIADNLNVPLRVEDWYLTETIDKNISNILNKANDERAFVQRLLFTEEKIPFKINKPNIKYLHSNGLIKKDENGYVTFWVPLYKKAVYDAFYPYSNGEKRSMLRSFIVSELFDDKGKLILNTLIAGYKEYVKRRSLKVFLTKDENGNYQSIKESALIYSFETYIQAFLQVVDGKSYREADTGLGKSDLIINVRSEEYLIETKVYYYEAQFLKGKEQLAYYCESLNLKQGIYLVFCPKDIRYPESIKEQKETISNIEITTYLIEYDDNKWE